MTMIKINQQVCLVEINSGKKICLTIHVGVPYKMLLSSYSVIVDHPGEGSSEKNCCW